MNVARRPKGDGFRQAAMHRASHKRNNTICLVFDGDRNDSGMAWNLQNTKRTANVRARRIPDYDLPDLYRCTPWIVRGDFSAEGILASISRRKQANMQELRIGQ
jgi:hypothetical protein